MKKRRKGPGHPITTRSASTPPVFYRVSADQHAELRREGRAQKPRITVNEAAKRRAFPPNTGGTAAGGKP
jgi:hypothetical protein